MTLSGILAKKEPPRTLQEHTLDVLKVMLELQRRYPEAGDKVFWQDLFTAGIYHDAGKITDNFQTTLQKGPLHKAHIRHEFISAILMLLVNTPAWLSRPEAVLAVMAHHKPLSDNLYANNIYSPLDLSEPLVIAWYQWVEQKLEELGIEHSLEKVSAIGSALEHTSSCEKLYHKLVENFFRRKVSIHLDKHNRKRYVLQKAMLHLADWTASAGDVLPHGFTYNDYNIREGIARRISPLFIENAAKKTESVHFTDFQRQALRKGHVLAVAPTGSGKTEAALLWASQKCPYERLVYLLPTRNTSNAIYQRLCDYFGKGRCAIVHASAFFYRKEQDEFFEKIDYLKDKAFSQPITVSTIDQMLTAGFNLGHWELKTFHLRNAWVVIDEIHLYEPYTLGLIIASMRYLSQEFGTHFFIMSATMPVKLKKLLQSALNDQLYELIDISLYDQARNVFESSADPLTSFDQDIEQALNEGKKVMVVRNTVDAAISDYERLKQYATNGSALCFHSRFTVKDRQAKADSIEKLDRAENHQGFLLVATQVVEVSLDIDFDYLYTENAPIDALVQRAGRVNRKRKKKGTRVVVFPASEIAYSKIYNAEIVNNTTKLLEKHSGMALSERQLTQMVEDVYVDLDIESNESYRSGLSAYEKIWKEHLHYVKDLSMEEQQAEEVFTRSGIENISVIPASFEDKLEASTAIEKSKHEVSISLKRFYMHRNRIHNDKLQQFRYFDTVYSDETGLIFPDKDAPDSDVGFAVL